MSNQDSARETLLDQLLYQSQLQTAATLLLENAIAERLKINMIDLHCSNLLRIMGPMTAGKLAEATGLTTGAITGMLDRLEKIGFVRREMDPSDRRRIFVHAQQDAMNTTIGPLYESLMQATLDLVSSYTDDQLSFMIDHMRSANALMMDETQRIRDAHTQKVRPTAFDHQDESVTLPLDTVSAGHLIMTEGAMAVTIATAAHTPHLLSGKFDKVIPGIATHSGVVRVIYPSGPAAQTGGGAALRLNDAIPWRIELAANSATYTADLSRLHLTALDLKAVSSTVEITLPAPMDIVPLRISGEASTVTLRCPPNTALSVTQRRGAGHIRVNGDEVKKSYQSPGYSDAVGRFEMDISARATPVNIIVKS